MRTKKAISEVLAMLLMVVIVVGLIGVVYFFLSGMVGRQTAIVITPVPQSQSCDPISLKRIDVAFTNEGTNPINVNDIRVFVDNKPVTIDFTNNRITRDDKTTPLQNQQISPGQTFWVLLSDVDPATGVQNPQPGRTYTIMIMYAGKTATVRIAC